MGTSVRLLTTKPDRALILVVVHQQDDGLGEVGIAQIAAGDQKLAHGEIVGLAESRRAGEEQEVRREVVPPCLSLAKLQCSWRFSE